MTGPVAVCDVVGNGLGAPPVGAAINRSAAEIVPNTHSACIERILAIMVGATRTPQSCMVVDD
jgi:hypothetical protein